MELTVVSYNLCLHKAYTELDKIVEIHKPDILCLQEYKTKVNTGIGDLKFLAASKIGQVANAIYYDDNKFINLNRDKNLALPKSTYEYFGTGKSFRLQLTTLKDKNSRLEFIIANVHLSHLLATNIARRKQMICLLDLTNKYRESLPAIIAGDFNYPLPDNHLRDIAETNSFVECGVNSSYITHKNKILAGKFDRIFITDNIREIDTCVIAAKKSDHLPIKAKLHMFAK